MLKWLGQIHRETKLVQCQLSHQTFMHQTILMLKQLSMCGKDKLVILFRLVKFQIKTFNIFQMNKDIINQRAHNKNSFVCLNFYFKMYYAQNLQNHLSYSCVNLYLYIIMFFQIRIHSFLRNSFCVTNLILNSFSLSDLFFILSFHFLFSLLSPTYYLTASKT